MTTNEKAQRLETVKLIHNARERLRRARLALDKSDVTTQAAAAQRVADASAALDALLHPAIAAAVAAAPAEPKPELSAVEPLVLGPIVTVGALAAAVGETIVMPRDAAPSLTPPAPPFTAAAFSAARVTERRCLVATLRQRLHRDERALGGDHPETVAVRAQLADALGDAALADFTDAERAELKAVAALPPPPPCVVDEANDAPAPRRNAWGKLTATPERLAEPDAPAPPPAKPKRARKAAAPAADKPAPAGKSAYGRVGTAAELYRRSIMEGLSDEACFARVKAELGDKAAGKDTYPGWYRAQLKKNGKHPPVSAPTTNPKTN